MKSNLSAAPTGYHTVTPYLIVPSVAAEIEFLCAAFHAEETTRHPHPDGSISHAEVRIGDSLVMMGESEEQGKAIPCVLHLYVANADETYGQALAAGATSLREPADQPYGDRMAGVQDPFGNQWWIATPIR